MQLHPVQVAVSFVQDVTTTAAWGSKENRIWSGLSFEEDLVMLAIVPGPWEKDHSCYYHNFPKFKVRFRSDGFLYPKLQCFKLSMHFLKSCSLGFSWLPAPSSIQHHFLQSDDKLSLFYHWLPQPNTSLTSQHISAFPSSFISKKEEAASVVWYRADRRVSLGDTALPGY